MKGTSILNKERTNSEEEFLKKIARALDWAHEKPGRTRATS